jgi:hypothetical protein
MTTMAAKVTPEHLRAAFESMAWKGWTFEAAMANDMRRRLLECRATSMAAREQQATRQRETVRRVRLDERGQVAGWCTQIVMGPRTSPQLEITEEA